MAPITLSISTITLFLVISLSIPSSISAVETLSAYDVLQSYDLPIGLLPKGATGYSLDPETGKFSLYRNGSCNFSLEGSYKLSYKPTIKGYISNNKLTSLSGVSVKILFLWFNIVEVVRHGDEVGFSVGLASASFGIENFEICPQCGCGLNCASDIPEKALLSSI